LFNLAFVLLGVLVVVDADEEDVSRIVGIALSRMILAVCLVPVSIQLRFLSPIKRIYGTKNQHITIPPTMAE